MSEATLQVASTATTECQVRRRSVIARLEPFLAYVVLSIIAFRLTVADWLPLFSVVYYATPWVLVCGASIVAAICSAIAGEPTRVGILLFAVVGSGLFVFQQSWRTNSVSAEDSDLSIFFWNVYGTTQGWDGIVETIRAHDPDIIAISEGGPNRPEKIARYLEAFPEYDGSDLKGGMIILTRGELGAVSYDEFGNHGSMRSANVKINGNTYYLVLVDIDSNPIYSRRRTLLRLASFVEQWEDRRLIVVGDFNTPLDSRHFDPLRRKLHHAFTENGNGWAPTWPLPIPMLELDHVWSNDRVMITECQHLWTNNSDHRPVFAKFRVAR
ncbi:MAG: endonuclease/exonuclease/phosphatase family protein [Pirellulaceae bacterium]|nr:endonuclease/exonuclease/phosphatase family protein [Planctomycetales bacterium]